MTMAWITHLTVLAVTVSVCLAFSMPQRTRPQFIPSSSPRPPFLPSSVGPWGQMSVRIVPSALAAPFYGTVLVTDRGQEGVICDDDWDIDDANVVCRMLGYSGAFAAFTRNQFGFRFPGRDVIMYDDVRCSGVEFSLEACDKSDFLQHNCNMDEAAGVGCTGHNPAVSSIRLEGGASPEEGTVIVQHLNDVGMRVVGLVCDDDWDITDANVVCRSLGYGGATQATVRNAFNYRGNLRDILLDDVACYGMEDSLYGCQHAGLGRHNCGMSDVAGVVCDGNRAGSSIRLEGGASPKEGTVIVQHGNEEGIVCENHWDLTDANVACRSLGYSGAIQATVRDAFNYSGNHGDGLLDNVTCTGDEESLDQCEHAGVGWHYCGWRNAAGVVCDGDDDPIIPSPGDDDPISVSLAGGNDLEGTVVVEYRGHRGVICDDSWDLLDGNVVCRMLGFRGALGVPGKNRYQYEGDTSDILFDDLRCSGEEKDLRECGHRGFRSHDCQVSEAAGVICAGPDSDREELTVQLVGGSESEGTVLVTHAGHRGVICDDFWGIQDANVVCRMLGFPRALEAAINNRFNFDGDQTDILLDDVRCSGDEESVADCPHGGLRTHNCITRETAGVVCDTGNPIVTSVRLEGGESPNEGTVMVQHGSREGLVCDDYWDFTDASVVCRSLGYSGATRATVRNAFRYRGNDRDILLDDVACTGAEESLAQCEHAGVGTHNCGLSEAAGVVCDELTTPYPPTMRSSTPEESTTVPGLTTPVHGFTTHAPIVTTTPDFGRNLGMGEDLLVCPPVTPDTPTGVRYFSNPFNSCGYYWCDSSNVPHQESCGVHMTWNRVDAGCVPLGVDEGCYVV